MQLPTVCQFCGQVDSLAHLIECVNIGVIPAGDDEEAQEMQISYVMELALRANNVNPKYPAPLIPGDGVEISLLVPSDSEDENEGAPEHRLDFDDDRERPLDHAELAGEGEQ